jgi:hypothetical protein
VKNINGHNYCGIDQNVSWTDQCHDGVSTATASKQWAVSHWNQPGFGAVVLPDRFLQCHLKSRYSRSWEGGCTASPPHEHNPPSAVTSSRRERCARLSVKGPWDAHDSVERAAKTAASWTRIAGHVPRSRHQTKTPDTCRPR